MSVQRPVHIHVISCLLLAALTFSSLSCEQTTQGGQVANTSAARRHAAIPVKNVDSVRNESPKQRSRLCPVCRRPKKLNEELCKSCNDEIANTCYLCGRRQKNVNGKLCKKCSNSFCAICNKRKESKDDELCEKCHNAIEERSKN